MSYNVSVWRTKKMDNFRIPLEAIHANDDLEVELEPDNKVFVSGYPEGLELEGTIENREVVVSKIDYGGEGSGSRWEEFKLLLGKGKGTLVSTQVWECGDSYTKLTVIDGVVTEEEIEL